MIENIHEAKSLNQGLPKPIALNCWKHHLGFVIQQLNNQTSYSGNEIFIREIVQFIGESQFDFYTGSLDVYSISHEVINQLKLLEVVNLADYRAWICSEGNDYKCISLSDGSSWTLRLGQNDDRYIHLHPSRHSKKTIRVKNSTLKTVYAMLFYYGLTNASISIEKVNYVRSKFVKLPPFKPSSALIAISRLFDLFIA
jgi:hypothetical protein